ncbi:ATP-dependent RNA helicase A-like [Crassostrea angulata]|uniref:ATP-dependent RNA helicase A-like n=1 Tax=Magallana angulata TaxID=2784310 RepID=UPI0022B08C82|nr:ATP-dependent RNA helicase A-like [Crassostrea angulata]
MPNSSCTLQHGTLYIDQRTVVKYQCLFSLETMKSFLTLTLAAVLLASCSAQWRRGPFIVGFGGDDGIFDDGFFDDDFYDDDFYDDDFFDDDSFGFFLGGPRRGGFGMGGVSPFVEGMNAGGFMGGMGAGVGGFTGASGFGGMGGMIGGHIGGSGYGKKHYGGYGKKMSGYGKKMTGYGKSSAISVPMVSGYHTSSYPQVGYAGGASYY